MPCEQHLTATAELNLAVAIYEWKHLLLKEDSPIEWHPFLDQQEAKYHFRSFCGKFGLA